jgi:Gluconate 2-dehydrogenase subunit 3
MPVWFSEAEHAVVAAAVERLIPQVDGRGPGARAAGVADYIDGALGAFLVAPPKVWAGGPFSGRFGGEASFDDWEPLSRLHELAWRIRVEGSRGRPEREFNGPVRGWQEEYRDGLAALGIDFADIDPDEQDARLAAAPEPFRALLHQHACEGMYGAPEYGGNRGGAAWAAIEYLGDVQPRGYSDDEVTQQ